MCRLRGSRRGPESSYLSNQTFHVSLHISGQDPHEGLGGKPVLGPLLVVALRHVGEHLVGGLVDVVDDLAEVSLEVALSEVLEVAESCGGNVSLPLEVALASVHHGPQTGVLVHEINERFADLEILGRDGALSTGGQSNISLLVGLNGLSGGCAGLSDVASEHNQIEVLVDVVHDLVAQLGLSDVLPELLDAGATSLLGPVQVDDLVGIVLGTSTVLQSSPC